MNNFKSQIIILSMIIISLMSINLYAEDVDLKIDLSVKDYKCPPGFCVQFSNSHFNSGYSCWDIDGGGVGRGLPPVPVANFTLNLSEVQKKKFTAVICVAKTAYTYTGRYTISVNGKMLDDNFKPVEMNFKMYIWHIPASFLHTGENEILITFADREGNPIWIKSATLAVD